MACNSCSKTYSLLRKEKGCPACGFSYCSNCLKYKIFVPKLNSEAKVCAKCERASKSSEKPKIVPPDAYFKRIGAMDGGTNDNSNISQPGASSSKDQAILDRLKKLKEDSNKTKQVSTEDIADRLNKIKGDLPSTSDAELQERLANIRGVPVSTLQSKPTTIKPDNRTEQEQVEDLLKQYMEQTKIDAGYKDQFDGVLDDIQNRLQKLKSQSGSVDKTESKAHEHKDESEEIVKNIIEKAKIDSLLENQVTDPEMDELPFCEICNEDATMRCLGCKYLFCKRCFMEHKDDDDGCNKYELYRPPKSKDDY